MSALRTTQQNTQLFAMLGVLGYDDEARHSLAYQYSGGRTESTKQLTVLECAELLKKLQDELDTMLRPMRGKVFSLCHQLGWVNGRSVDYKHLDNWLAQYGTHKVHLLKQTKAQLRDTITQLEQLVKHG